VTPEQHAATIRDLRQTVLNGLRDPRPNLIDVIAALDALVALARASLQLRAALEQIAEQQPKTIDWLRANGIIFDGPLGTDPDNWENVAFSIYSDLCETDAIARAAIAGEQAGEEADRGWAKRELDKMEREVEKPIRSLIPDVQAKHDPFANSGIEPHHRQDFRSEADQLRADRRELWTALEAVADGSWGAQAQRVAYDVRQFARAALAGVQAKEQ